MYKQYIPFIFGIMTGLSLSVFGFGDNAPKPEEPIPVASTLTITDIAGQSTCSKYSWASRGKAPAGYVKGMALVYAKSVCRLNAGHSGAKVMAKANTGIDSVDVISWFNSNFKAIDMSNSESGFDTMRHLYTLQIGLGMRESSGRWCEGRDKSATNTTAETAEAGMFQTSYNSRSATSELPKLFSEYKSSKSCFLDTFREGVSCSTSELSNYGSAEGKEFQRLSKECPAFAVEYAAIGMRTIRKHWGPLNRKEAQINASCDSMLSQVEKYVLQTPKVCDILL